MEAEYNLISLIDAVYGLVGDNPMTTIIAVALGVTLKILFFRKPTVKR